MSATKWASAIGQFTLAMVAVVSIPERAQPAPATEKTMAKDLQALAEARCEAAKKAYEQLFESTRLGYRAMPDQERLYLWSRRWLEAALDASVKTTDRIAAFQGHRDRMNELAARVRQMSKEGWMRSQLPAAEYYLLEAEFWLARAALE